MNSFELVAVCGNKVECCFDNVNRCFGIYGRGLTHKETIGRRILLFLAVVTCYFMPLPLDIVGKGRRHYVFGLFVRHVRSFGQILLPWYLMNGFSNFEISVGMYFKYPYLKIF